MEKFFAITGWIRKDDFGRVVIDECPSDPTHLAHSPTDPETNKPSCRYLIDELFSRERTLDDGVVDSRMMNRKGSLIVTVQFIEDRGAGTIEEAVQKYIEWGRS